MMLDDGGNVVPASGGDAGDDTDNANRADINDAVDDDSGDK
jgi:hypothetical protein